MTLLPAARLGVSTKPVSATGCIAGGGLDPLAATQLLTVVAKLTTRVVCCPSWATSSLLVGGFYIVY